MKYLLLAYETTGWWEALSISQRQVFEDACQANDKVLQDSGKVWAAAKIQGHGTVAMVSVQNGEVVVADESLVETPKRLSGLFFIHTRDLNEAIQVAAKMPQVRGGVIEVRPITV